MKNIQGARKSDCCTVDPWSAPSGRQQQQQPAHDAQPPQFHREVVAGAAHWDPVIVGETGTAKPLTNIAACQPPNY